MDDIFEIFFPITSIRGMILVCCKINVVVDPKDMKKVAQKINMQKRKKRIYKDLM